jgi:hypothetical protein
VQRGSGHRTFTEGGFDYVIRCIPTKLPLACVKDGEQRRFIRMALKTKDAAGRIPDSVSRAPRVMKWPRYLARPRAAGPLPRSSTA